MSQELRREVLRLLAALCDGELTDAEHARVEELLAADAECRRLYLAYVDMHAYLLVRPHPAAVASEEPETEQADEALARPARGRAAQTLRYLAVAAVSVAAVLLVQAFTHKPLPADPTGGKSASQGTPLPPSVATLSQAPNCVWDPANAPPRTGPRLAPGPLRLQKGVARIRFDSGPDLVIEGPVNVRVDSGNAATVLQGKVVCRADETTSPFDLHTPSSTLVNADGEYAVAVSDEGEEVHVFDGEVQRTPRGGTPEKLIKGEARGYGPNPDAPGQPKVLDPDGFVRQLSDAVAPADAAAGLLAYEGFDYPSADALRAGKANGGAGWVGPWRGGFARPLLEGDTNLLALNVKEGLARPSATVAPVGGAFEYVGFAKYHRKLATPVRLDADGVYYLSFLFRREGPPADPLNALAILFRTTDELARGKEDARLRLNVGVGGVNQLFTHLDKIGSRTPVPLRHGETYLMVAKIVASPASNAQVFMRVYGPDEPVEQEEWGGWTVTGPPLTSKLVFDWMEIHINSKTRQTIDEIRLGLTWSSVTAPWAAGPAEKQAGKQ
jgi:hypothetical protein